MADEILRKYLTRNGGIDSDTDSDPDGTEDLGAFGWMRGQRDRCIMLELRKKDGSVVAIGYGWIERVEFEPSEGITLYAHGQKYRIRGRNLNAEVRPQMRLLHGICRHRVPWIMEADRAADLQAGRSAIVIEAIES